MLDFGTGVPDVVAGSVDLDNCVVAARGVDPGRSTEGVDKAALPEGTGGILVCAEDDGDAHAITTTQNVIRINRRITLDELNKTYLL